MGCLSTSSRVIEARSVINSGDRASCAVSSSSSGLIRAREGGASKAGRCTFPTELTKATISTPYAILRYFSAIAPAATRPDGNEKGYAALIRMGQIPMVSLALLRPPPLLAFIPYFSR